MLLTSRTTPLLRTAVACELGDSAIPTVTGRYREGTGRTRHVIDTDMIQRHTNYVGQETRTFNGSRKGRAKNWETKASHEAKI